MYIHTHTHILFFFFFCKKEGIFSSKTKLEVETPSGTHCCSISEAKDLEEGLDFTQATTFRVIFSNDKKCNVRGKIFFSLKDLGWQ